MKLLLIFLFVLFGNTLLFALAPKSANTGSLHLEDNSHISKLDWELYNSNYKGDLPSSLQHLICSLNWPMDPVKLRIVNFFHDFGLSYFQKTEMHEAIDIVVPKGTQACSVLGGRVVAKYMGFNGLEIWVYNEENHLLMSYTHINKSSSLNKKLQGEDFFISHNSEINIQAGEVIGELFEWNSDQLPLNWDTKGKPINFFPKRPEHLHFDMVYLPDGITSLRDGVLGIGDIVSKFHVNPLLLFTPLFPLTVEEQIGKINILTNTSS